MNDDANGADPDTIKRRLASNMAVAALKWTVNTAFGLNVDPIALAAEVLVKTFEGPIKADAEKMYGYLEGAVSSAALQEPEEPEKGMFPPKSKL